MNEEKKKALRALKTARGQVDGIIKMIEEGRYCVDISNQILASASILKRAQMLILKQHIKHCVHEAFEEGNVEEKLDEVMSLIERLVK